MSDEKKETEFVQGVEVVLTGIEVETENNDPTMVKRIKFDTNKGNITFKPKLHKEEFRNGLKITSVVPCTVETIPQKIIDMAKKIQELGSLRLNVEYTVMSTEKDGEEVKYRFITSMKTFEKWIVVGSTSEALVPK